MCRCIFLKTAFALAVLVAGAGFQNDSSPADLILQNGKIVTVDEKTPQVEAIAVKGERIVATGTDDEIAKFIGPNVTVRVPCAYPDHDVAQLTHIARKRILLEEFFSGYAQSKRLDRTGVKFLKMIHEKFPVAPAAA